MKKMNMTLLNLLLLGSLCSCKEELIEYTHTDVSVRIEQGDAWLHDFPLFMGLKMKNPPQIAIWIEDTHGNYLSTVYASHKIATQSWQAAGGNRRKEALPHWCHIRGIKYEDGLYLPTKDKPVTDGITGATPKKSFDVKLQPSSSLQQFVVKIELNHSTDFNQAYPKSAKIGDTNYSGGTKGSGQPAVVYSAAVDLSSGQKSFDATLVGHSSPDGSDGKLNEDISKLTTALHIVKRITIEIQK